MLICQCACHSSQYIVASGIKAGNEYLSARYNDTADDCRLFSCKRFRLHKSFIASKAKINDSSHSYTLIFIQKKLPINSGAFYFIP